MKFGGTSVQDAAAFGRVLEIIKNERERLPVVVLSACSGITDKLIKMIKTAVHELGQSRKAVSEIEQYHKLIINELITSEDIKASAFSTIDNLCGELYNLSEGVFLLKECTPRSLDSAAAYGELLSSNILFYYLLDNGLDAAFEDARRFMKSDDNFCNASIIRDLTYNSINKIFNPHLNENRLIVTQGFISSDESDRTTTLGRGGSDYSAAVIGSAMSAEEIEIWTDVSGILTADPRMIKDARTIPVMSFSEVRELSFFGAKVLHPDTIKPAVDKNIPVRVLNSYKPEDLGTVIINKTEDPEPVINSVVLKKDCLLCTLINIKNSETYFPDFLKECIANGFEIISALSVDNKYKILLNSNGERTETKLVKLNFEIEFREVALIALCGENLLKFNNKTAGYFNILSGFSPLSLNYGISDNSIIAVIPGGLSGNALKKVHEEITK